MSDSPAAPPLVVNVQYIKDLSFEVPGAPVIYSTLKTAPRVDINLDVQARRRGWSTPPRMHSDPR
jgi:preprotein translocase subunit SecB